MLIDNLAITDNLIELTQILIKVALAGKAFTNVTPPHRMFFIVLFL